jgi:hypothetical protein
LVARLRAARDPQPDSPIFQLIESIRPPEIDHTKTDVFRDRVRYSARVKAELTAARRQGRDALSRIAERLGPITDCEAGVVIDLFLSYRAVEAWEDMIALVDRMSAPLSATVIVQEQLALALNRAGAGERAEEILLSLIDRRGPSSETYGILGRVYKDRWEAALRRGENQHLVRGFLTRAIAAYLRGFETDWRDAYPGINAITLMEIADPPDDRRTQILPVVTYSVERKIAVGSPDYWDYATRLELAVLAIDEARSVEALADTLSAVREPWEPKTTARNLRLIREAREARGTPVPWATRLEEALERRTRP